MRQKLRFGFLAGCVIICFLCAGRPAGADEPSESTEPAAPLIADRPDLTESSSTVPPHHLQTEMGIEYATLGSDNELVLPMLLLRWGATKNFELRLQLPSVGVELRRGDDGKLDAFATSAVVGLKYVVEITKSFRVGVLPYAEVPIYSEGWKTLGAAVGLKGLWAWDLNEVLALSGNLGAVVSGFGASEADLEPIYLASLSLGISLTERFGTFFEIYSFADRDFTLFPVFDGGATLLLRPDVQLDLYAGVGLTDESRGMNAGLGATILF